MERLKLNLDMHGYLVRLFKERSDSPTEFHARVLVILDRAFGGLYNSPLARAIYRKGQVRVGPDAMYIRWQGFTTMASNDARLMTSLVVLARHFAIRVELSLEGRALWLRFHERRREGSFWRRHPFLEESAAEILKGLEGYRVEVEGSSIAAQGSGAVDAGPNAAGSGVPAGSCAAVGEEAVHVADCVVITRTIAGYTARELVERAMPPANLRGCRKLYWAKVRDLFHLGHKEAFELCQALGRSPINGATMEREAKGHDHAGETPTSPSEAQRRDASATVKGEVAGNG